MKTKLLIGCWLYLAACSSSETKTTSNTNKQHTDSATAYSEPDLGESGEVAKEVKQKNENEYWERLVMHEMRDNNGVVSAVLPMPASWRLGKGGEPSLIGPNGIKVIDHPLKSFMINYDPSIQRAYANQQMREFPGIEQLIQQDFIPWGNSQNLQFVKWYEIPEISKMDKWYSDQLFKALPSRSDVGAIGTDWKTADGKPLFLLIHLNVNTSEQMQGWWYRVSSLHADPDYFEAARKQFIFTLSNMRYNLEPIMAYNRAEAERCGRSWAAHNQRMAQNQANFEASQRAFVNRSNAVNDAIMSGWRERNASSDRMHERTIDAIREETNVVDPSTGQGYKVAAGANQYWMNNDGQYIGTQLQDYNPNLDDNMNGQKWQQLQPRPE